jgi:hypothetical protein
MFRTVITSLSLASAALVGMTATPVFAQEGYRYSESYDGPDGSYRRTESREEYDGYRGGYDRGAYQRGDYYQGGGYAYNDRPVEYRRDNYYRPAYGNGYRGGYSRCSSGTTGAIAGAVLGGLLGREIGRGGRWNQPSGTGLILGAGAGALAGRAIERGDCR